HFFGFFSAFNPDVVKDFKLYKSGIPAEFGGRISSVFDINTKSGNTKKIAGSGGISPVTAKLMVEGPIVKDKGSFVLAARGTYSDWLMTRFPNSELRNSEASFYDMNLTLTQQINAKNTISVSAYMSQDRFKLRSDTVYRYNNFNGTFSWNHHFSDRFIGEASAIASNYAYDISSDGNPVNAYSMLYRILYMEGRTDFIYFPNNDHKVKFGVSSVSYNLQPGSRNPLGEESLVKPVHMEREKAHDLSIYLSEEYTLSAHLSFYGGLRYSLYRFLGPKSLFQYAPGAVELYNLEDTVAYGPGTIQTYHGPELRFSARYKFDNETSLKLSYNRLRQSLHMLSNTTAISPTDTWKLSDPHIRPQVGDQVALGFYRDFRHNTIETSMEIYYKYINDIIEYQSGANLLLNPHIETDLINGIGQAYGTELLIRKTSGRFNGWMSYTYSRTFIKVDGEVQEEKINNGAYFPANYDKPHDFTMVTNYKFSRRFSLSGTLTYSTGRPITYPVAKYRFRNATLAHYSFRNEYRVPDYFRCDISANLEGNLRSKKLAHSFWSLSVYNLTGRNNVYSIYFITQGGELKGYKMSIFDRPVPTLTYTFKF
ncbi:MAG: TonB-dependent receptor, partial [Bacteroidales bacterium]|nr:TonB-dependent receptor [Bacteroidales bacterium]